LIICTICSKRYLWFCGILWWLQKITVCEEFNSSLSLCFSIRQPYSISIKPIRKVIWIIFTYFAVAVAKKSYAPDWEQRSKVVGSIPSPHTSNFSAHDCKKIKLASSVRVIVICSHHRLPWLDSCKDVDSALKSDERVFCSFEYGAGL